MYTLKVFSGIIAFIGILILGNGPAEAQLGHWQHCNGPYGGTIRGMVEMPGGELIIAVGGYGQIYASTDEGNSWTMRNSGLEDAFPMCMLKTAQGTLLVGTYTGMWRSTDRGGSWTEAPLTPQNYEFRSICQHPDGSIIAGCGLKGLLISSDDGISWNPLGGGPQSSTRAHSLFIADDGTMYLSTMISGGYRSTNKGVDWERILNGYVYSLFTSPGGRIFARVSAQPLLVSDDNGASWQADTLQLPNSPIAYVSMSNTGEIMVCPSSPQLRGYLAISMDEGNTWQDFSSGMWRGEVIDVFTSSKGVRFACTDKGGVYRRDVADTSWSKTSIGILAAEVNHLCTLPDGRILGGGLSGMFRSSNAGSDWEEIGTDKLGTDIYDIVVTHDATVFVALDESGLFSSTDGGDTWTNAGFAGQRVRKLAVGPDNTLFVGVSRVGVYSSSDGGSHWRLDSAGLYKDNFQDLLCMNDGTLFAATGIGIYRSLDHARSWHPANNGLTETYTYLVESVNDIVFGTGNEAVRSTDHGDTWVPIATDQPYDYNMSLVGTPDSAILMSTGMGILRSVDRGQNWVPFNEGLDYIWMSSLALDAQGHPLAGTEGASVYRFIPTVTGTEVTIRSNPPGRSITVDGTEYATAQTFDWQPQTIHTVSTRQMQSGTTGTRYVWQDWSDGGDVSHMITVGNSAQVITANFSTEYQLQMIPDGSGSVTPQTGWYNPGAAVSIRATPQSGQTFNGWGGSGPGSYTGTANPATVTMNGAITETAHFTSAGESREVTITADPPGRRITVDGESFSTQRTYTWQVGTDHEIGTTSPQTGSPGLRYVWNSWSDGQAMTHTWTVPAGAAMTLTASFDMEYQLTMTAGSGGSVSPATGWYAGGTQVQLQATPDAGYAFDRWEGTGSGAYSGTANPATVTIQNALSESAVFRRTTSVPASTAAPATIILRQNAPNPVRDETVLSFSLPRAQSVTLVVTDILGHEMKRLIDQATLSAGEHQVVLQGAGFPSGVYLYRLETEDGVRVRAMVLQK